MEEIEDNSIDTIVTSCPYWGLRDYGKEANQIWGGGPECKHEWIIEKTRRPNASGGKTDYAKQKLAIKGKDNYSEFVDYFDRTTKSSFCQLCGAWYGQLGLEPTLEMYIEHLLIITAECKRVLKPTGVMWWNHGDCYSAKRWSDSPSTTGKSRKCSDIVAEKIHGLPDKCMVLQNFRLIIRLIDEQGWILRNTAIWNKPNSMPSSTKDRLTNKYEPVFFLVKNTKTQYYWNEKTGLMANRKSSPLQENIDWEWIECPKCSGAGEIIEGIKAGSDDFGIVLSEKGPEICPRCKGSKKIKHSFWHSLDYWFDLDAIREPYTKPLDRWGGDKTKPTDQSKGNQFAVQERVGRERRPDPSGKNPGDIWTIPTQPYPSAHFATFPEKLIIKPILSSCPAEICKKCGKARVRVKGKPLYGIGDTKTKATENGQPNIKHLAERRQFYRSLGYESPPIPETIGWTDCGCNAGWRAGIILDPFAGSGTTLAMAKRCGRQFIAYEIVKSYIPLIRKRLAKEGGLFNRDLKEQFI